MLYLGSLSAAHSLTLLRELGVRSVVNCTTMRPRFPENFAYFNCPLDDTADARIDAYFDDASAWARCAAPMPWQKPGSRAVRGAQRAARRHARPLRRRRQPLMRHGSRAHDASPRPHTARRVDACQSGAPSCPAEPIVPRAAARLRGARPRPMLRRRAPAAQEAVQARRARARRRTEIAPRPTRSVPISDVSGARPSRRRRRAHVGAEPGAACSMAKRNGVRKRVTRI